MVGVENILTRLSYKAKSTDKSLTEAERRKCKGLSDTYKLALNSGYFGKTLERTNWQYAPEVGYYCTIGNQFEILMLIEMLEIEGIHTVSANTDGILCYFPEDLGDKYLEVCHKWERIVGNSDMGMLEYTEFDCIYQESVNSYIAKKTTGGVKKKGRFCTEYDLHKNKSKRIIPLALEKYFVDGTSPVEFISKHKNIYDFCVGKKANKLLHYEEIKGEEVKVHKKLVRYYISEEGSILMKRGLDEHGQPMNNHCEAIDKNFPWIGQPVVTYFNRVFPGGEVNHKHYILETLKRIDKIERSDKARRYADLFKTTQYSLF